MARRRRGSDSRTCSGSGPFTWVDYVDPDHPSVQAFQTWLESLAPFARAHELGEIDELFEAAAAGLLYDTGDATSPIKPIREDPEIFELRRTALSKRLRFYHGEPAELPTSLVALHRHIKQAEPGQQLEVEHAADRYDAGRHDLWRKETS